MNENILFSLLLVLALWLFIRVLVPQLVSDLFKDKLAQLKEELFQLAIHEDGYFFDTPLYHHIDGYIEALSSKTVHIYTYVAHLMYDRLRKKEKLHEYIRKNSREVEKEMEELIAESHCKNSERFTRLLNTVSFYHLLYSISQSLIFMLFFSIILIIVLFYFMLQYLYAKCYKTSMSFKAFVFTKINHSGYYIGSFLFPVPSTAKRHI